MRKNIGYHTRLCDNDQKIVGGSFGGAIDLETVDRLVSAHFTVVVKPSGTAVFVDKEGRSVRLYLSVDPEVTRKGALAVSAWREARAQQEAQDAARCEREQEELRQLTEGLSHEEIVRRLKGESK